MLSSGDIVVDFPGVQGVKRRPAIVVSSDEYHRTRPDVIVGLVTSQIPAAPAPSDYVLTEWRAAGLNKASAFRTFLVTLPRTAISSTIGRPTSVDWDGILRSVRGAISS